MPSSSACSCAVYSSSCVSWTAWVGQSGALWGAECTRSRLVEERWLGWAGQRRAGRAGQDKAGRSRRKQMKSWGMGLATDRQASGRHNYGCSECYTQGLGSTETGHSSSSGRLSSTSQASHLHTVTNGNITLTIPSPMPPKLLNPPPNTQSTDKLLMSKVHEIKRPAVLVFCLVFILCIQRLGYQTCGVLRSPGYPVLNKKYSATTVTNMVRLEPLRETVASTEIYQWSVWYTETPPTQF